MVGLEDLFSRRDTQSATLFGGPLSLWLHRETVDVCTWMPQIMLSASVDRARLRADGFARMPPRGAERLQQIIASQLVVPQRFRSDDGEEVWASQTSLDQAQAVPVQLGFQITASAHALIPFLPKREETTVFPIANPLPPSAWGECALIDNGQGYWHLQTLAATGDAGFGLWEQIGALIKTLAVPLEWPIYTELLAQCATPGAYERLRTDLTAASRHAKGDERQQLLDQVKALKAAYKQVLALQEWRERQHHDMDGLQADWQHLRALSQQLVLLYWQAYQEREGRIGGVVLSTRELDGVVGELAQTADEQAQLGIMHHVPASPLSDSLIVPIYEEDRAAREASLVPTTKWGKKDGVYHYQASNSLTISIMGTPSQPIPSEDAQIYLVQRSESTALTARIVMGLWNLRRHDDHLTWKGGAAIRIDEILEWRGIRKQSRPAYPGAPAASVTDGYRTEHKEQVQHDMRILSHYYIRGSHTLTTRGRAKTITVSGQYLMATEITQRDLWGKQEHLIGYFVTPGDWILAYDSYSSLYLVELDRRIFQLTPHNEQHELRLALYLTERWREQAHQGSFAEPLTMFDLLTASIIEVNRHNLTSRFIPRIEHALENLQSRGILGEYRCLTPPDTTKRNWGAEWLASEWVFLPPVDPGQQQLMAPRMAIAPGESEQTTEEPRQGRGKTRRSITPPGSGETQG